MSRARGAEAALVQKQWKQLQRDSQISIARFI